jgi:hypothetical protein
VDPASASAARNPSREVSSPEEGAKQVGPSLVGLYYTRDFSDWLARGEAEPHALGESVPLSLMFEADGTLVIQAEGFAGMEKNCHYKSEPGLLELQLTVKCEGEDRPRSKYHWAWRSADEAETDLLKDAELRYPIVVRARKTFKEHVREYEAAFHARHLARLAGRYSSADGLVLEIDAKGWASLGGRRASLNIIECVTEAAPEHGETACVVVEPKTSGEGALGEWVAQGEGRELTLIEGVQAYETREGIWPGGFEVKPGGRTLKRVVP